MDFISYQDFQKYDIYQDFIKQNPSTGSLKIQVTSLSSAVPVGNVEISIYKDIGEFQVLFFKGKTNSSGVIESIVLPAPRSMSFSSLDIPDYSIYYLDAFKEGFQKVQKYNIGVFSNIRVIQNIEMRPDINIEKIS